MGSYGVFITFFISQLTHVSVGSSLAIVDTTLRFSDVNVSIPTTTRAGVLSTGSPPTIDGILRIEKVQLVGILPFVMRGPHQTRTN